MRGVDVLLAFPALLVLLLLVAGLGSHVGVLDPRRRAGAASADRAHHPHGDARGPTRGYIEAAQARGERTSAILASRDPAERRPLVLADFGIRFGFSIILIASVNYLGLGLAPPPRTGA